MVNHLGNPAIIAIIVRFLSACQHCIGTAHECNITLRSRLRWMWVEIGGIAVIPTEVALIDRLAVVPHGSVVASVGEGGT